MPRESDRLRADLRSALAPLGSGQNFVTSLFLASALQNLLERHWILTRNLASEQPAFDAFAALTLRRELAALRFLEPWLGTDLSAPRLKALSGAARDLAQTFVSESLRYGRSEIRAFLRVAVHTMAELCAFEEGLANTRQEDFLPPSAYRAFDAFDEIFGLRFETDGDLKQEAGSRERLYLGGGAGVQTSYATILAALENLNLPVGGHLIDLGSGFGRVGLVAGLWREDLRFSGYEYVGHRVKVANDSAARADLSARVRFLEQDLADPSFRIPLADAYYMYDPFCAETYERVLRQLNDFSQEHSFTVVTKADAGSWLQGLKSQGSWAAPEKHDSGMLLMFRSQPQLARNLGPEAGCIGSSI